MKRKTVELELSECDDGHWLLFKSKDIKSAIASVSINLDVYFSDDSITSECVRKWANDQFEGDNSKSEMRIIIKDAISQVNDLEELEKIWKILGILSVEARKYLDRHGSQVI